METKYKYGKTSYFQHLSNELNNKQFKYKTEILFYFLVL